ncbi:MAG: DUF4249 domain-containing protein [Saprospiraceae bacterium]|nr:DUF4249 domain-containing protein [Saprospiraceae bacterium]
MTDYKFSILFLSCLILLATACQKTLDITLPDHHQSQIFVEGILYMGEAPRIYLSESASFFSDKVTPQDVFVRNANVRLSEGSNIYFLQMDSTFDKFRCRWVPFYTTNIIVEKDRTYQLHIDANGSTLTGETSTALQPITITDVAYTPEFFDVFGGHDGVIIRFQDNPGEGDYYRFQMDRWIDTSRYHAHALDGLINTCVEEDELFFVSDLGRTIFSDFTIDGALFELYLEVSFEYEEGDTATIYMQTLDEHAASFYSDMDKQLESILNPFVEPAFLHSTVQGGLGVFGSAIRSPAVQFIYPQDNP